MKVQKKLASFYIFGYLLEFRIECDDFIFFQLDFFSNVGEEKLKKHYHHLEKI